MGRIRVFALAVVSLDGFSPYLGNIHAPQARIDRKRFGAKIQIFGGKIDFFEFSRLKMGILIRP
jgi:hypothetical protein